MAQQMGGMGGMLAMGMMQVRAELDLVRHVPTCSETPVMCLRILTRALPNHPAFCLPGPHLSKQGIPHMPMMAAAQGNPKSSNYKTRICLNWHKTGHCQYAARCNFAHGHMELRVGMDKVYNRARLLDCTWSLVQSVLVTYCG